MNEFHFVARRDDGTIKHETLIYHCPWCGGVTPKSKRETFFAAIPFAEDARIRAVFKGLKTIKDVIDELGPANYDNPDANMFNLRERDGLPPLREGGHYLRYDHLSDVVDVHVREHPGRGIWVSLTGKYLGWKSSV